MAAGSRSGAYWNLLSEGGSIINGDERYMNSWATTIICKGIIEAFINRPVVVLQC